MPLIVARRYQTCALRRCRPVIAGVLAAMLALTRL
jgi:hypothetical protein